MIDHYKNTPKYANIFVYLALTVSIVWLFIDWREAILGFIIVIFFKLYVRTIRARNLDIAKRQKSHQGIAELRRRGLSDEHIDKVLKEADEIINQGKK